MGAPQFADKNAPPTEEGILAALGRAGGAWRMLFERIRAEHPDITEAWNYYTDGKSWLLKATRKTKTVFWLAVEQGAFRVTFYFPERLAGALLQSELSDEIKDALRSRAPTGKLRAVTVTFGPQRGVRDVMALISLKKALK